jgi:hypothetical protein
MNRNRTKDKPRTFWGIYLSRFRRIWRRGNRSTRVIAILVCIAALFVSANYAVSYWYMQRHAAEPLKIGTTFVPRYARYYGLDPQATMQAMIDEVGFKRFRLVSYWDDIEKTQGIYDFEELDWQFRMAEEAGAEVNLAIGLRQPRWPECHMPQWAEAMPKEQWYPHLKDFMGAVIERYKDSPALTTYQLENEFFMTIFGECHDFDRERLVDEYNFVKELDPSKPITITRSNNWGGVPVGEPTPDQFGVAVYKRVWDKTMTKRYFEYPYPPWFYGMLAGAGEAVSGKDMIIHELQMEPWLAEGKDFEMNDIESISEQNKSMNAERLKDRFEYGRETGIRTIDTWGAEWWYWRKVKADDPSLWNVAIEEVRAANEGRYNH